MEAKILDEILTWCSSASNKLPLKKRFPPLLSLFNYTFPIIKIAGTNGKGSTASMLSSCFVAEGTRVGLFTSPHLVSITERFRIDGKQVALPEITATAEKLKPILLEYVAKNGREFIPSFFEVLILIAIDIFSREGVEVAIFEAGIGGENDATSVLPGILSLITSIGLDHKDQLGETLESVALDKTGIANKGTPLLINSAIPDDVKAVIVQKASRNQVTLMESGAYITQYETDLRASKAWIQIDQEEMVLHPALKGSFQQENLNLVIEAWRYLIRLGKAKHLHSLQGVNTTDWEARFEVMGEGPTWILDAAHNPPAIKALIQALDQVSSRQERVLLFGNSEEKDYQEILQLIPAISAEIYIVDGFYKAIPQPNFTPHIDPDYVLNIGNSKISDTLAAIKEKHADRIIVVTGSIFMVGIVRDILTQE